MTYTLIRIYPETGFRDRTYKTLDGALLRALAELDHDPSAVFLIETTGWSAFYLSRRATGEIKMDGWYVHEHFTTLSQIAAKQGLEVVQ